MDFEHFDIFKNLDIDDWFRHESFCKSYLDEIKEDLPEEKVTEKTTLICDTCETEGMEIIDTYINKFGQLISMVKCPGCGHIEAICEHGVGKEIERY